MWRSARGATSEPDVDDQVGRLLQYLRDAQLLDESFLLFTADHGEMLGDHHMLAKAAAFEGSARVPFLARAPRSFDLPIGGVVDAPVGLQDVMSTLIDVAGGQIPEAATGASVLPLMAEATSQATRWRETLHGEHSPAYSGDYGMHYLVDDRYKYIWYTQSGREFFFDSESDPHEAHNLVEDPEQRDRVEQFRSRLVEVLVERSEGFVDRGRLVGGRPHAPLTTPTRGPW